MFPADRLPIPVFVVYDSRKKRVRKWFANGLSREARSFFAAKSKQGKNPKLVRAEPELRLFETEDNQ